MSRRAAAAGRFAAALALGTALALAAASAHAGRPLEPADWYRFVQPRSLQVSADGQSVAWLATRYEREPDEARESLWIAPWAGGEARQLTQGASVGLPRFVPGGRTVSYTRAPAADEPVQLWLLDLRGGEPVMASHVTGTIDSYEWLPDGRHVVLAMRTDDAPVPVAGKPKPVRPIVIDAFQFKDDDEGYRKAGSHLHLWLLDVASGEATQLTDDDACDDANLAVSADGRAAAYSCHRNARQADLGRDEVRVIEPRVGARPRVLATVDAPNAQQLAFSPDGQRLALLVGDAQHFSAYLQDRLALIDVASGSLRVLETGLDRALATPCWSADGRSLVAVAEDDGWRYPVRIEAAGGQATRLADHVLLAALSAGGGHLAAIASGDFAAPEVHALEGGALRALSHHNDTLFGDLAMGTMEDVRFTSRDGSEVHGLLHKPPGFDASKRYPLVLWIHGGPNGQDEHGIELSGSTPGMVRRLLASRGYLVLGVNYRGSTGRGAAFARAIAGDWGHLEVEDLLAGVDYVLGLGIADPARLGIGGWSYGGILTDYAIASDGRFRVAASGAGSAQQVAMYGTDQYILQYNAELGPPWQSQSLWEKLSYPFWHADRIHTPVLFMGGERDFNVPLAGGEQMYQALRTLGVPTQLVVYPGEHHSFKRPTFLADRWQRYLDWLGRYLQPKEGS